MGGISCPTLTPHKKFILCGTGPKGLLNENGVRCESDPTPLIIQFIIKVVDHPTSRFECASWP